MKPSIWQRAAKRFEDGVEHFGACQALYSNSDLPEYLVKKEAFEKTFKPYDNFCLYYFGPVKFFSGSKEEVEAANNHRIIALLLMHELERTGDLKKIIEQERK